MNTTIEDVLKKHDLHLYEKNNFYARIIYAMQEWAALQTPSNEKYGWVKASDRLPEGEGTYYCKYKNEKYCLPFDGHDFLFAIGEPIPNEETEWLDESTPIPIQTPCVELEKGFREHLNEELSLLVSIENDLPKEGLGRIFVKNRIDFLKRKLDATTH